MANPNINNATTVLANNNQLSLTTTSASQLITNAASSNKLFLIDSIIIANITASAVNITVTLFQSATNTGTAFELMPSISVPANSSITIGKNDGLNLLENESIYVSCSTANAVKVNVFWKEYS